MRADRAIRTAIYAVFAAVAVYIALFLLEAKFNPLQTILAAEHTADSTHEVSGWILREETVLSGYGTEVSVQAEEGEKIGAGQNFAVRYAGAETLQQVTQLNALRLRQAQLQQALTGTGNAAEQAENAAGQLAAAVARRDLSALDALSLSVSICIFDGGADESALQETLAELEAEILQLEEAVTGDSQWIAAAQAGIFSAVTDGYEYLAPADLEGLDPAALREMMGGGKVSHADALGKVVAGNRWYYAVILEEHVAMSLVGREECAAEFPRYFDGEVELTLERVGQAVDGESVVVFSSAQSLAQMLTARQAEGRLILRSCTGIRIPVDAVHTDEDGQSFVYGLEGLQAKRVDVTLLEEYSGFWYAQKGEDLRQGMEIITQAKDLYDGKVVQ